MEINKVYNMDNLELLKELELDSIDLIYCDILYNTGRKFKDYNDKLGTQQQAIEWYRPRLIEMKRVLKDTGSIYLQCDYRLVHYLKVEMDSIFGIENFRNDITWKRQSSSGAKSKSKFYARNRDNILFYTKSNTYTWNSPYKPYDDNYLKRFSHKDEDGRKFMDCRLGDYSEESIEKMLLENRIYVTKNGKKRMKRYLDEQKGVAVDDLWIDIFSVNSQSKEKVEYETQKPKELLRRIILTSSNGEDVVADFFCGSGTSLVVAKELGRKYIGCDISEKAVEITNERLSEINTYNF